MNQKMQVSCPCCSTAAVDAPDECYVEAGAFDGEQYDIDTAARLYTCSSCGEQWALL